MSNKIEHLEVYILSEAFADEIWSLVIKWDFFAKDTVKKQFTRSSDSISANIAEGFGRYHYKENKNFCYFSRGSVIETKSWLKKSYTRQLITLEQYQSLLNKLETIHFKLNAYIKFIGKMTNDQ
jgi:four helix bundle protein